MVSEKTRAEDEELRERLRRADPEKLKKAIKAVVAPKKPDTPMNKPRRE